MVQEGSRRVDALEAEAFARRLLSAHGVPSADAAVAASSLILADLRNEYRFGMSQIPGLIEQLVSGRVQPMVELTVERTTSLTATVDGRGGIGAVVMTRAMAEAVALGDDFGVGMVSAQCGTHLGLPAYYALLAAGSNRISVVLHGSYGEAFSAEDAIVMGLPTRAYGPIICDARTEHVEKLSIAVASLFELPVADSLVSSLSGLCIELSKTWASESRLLERWVDGDATFSYTCVAIKPDFFSSQESYFDVMDSVCREIKNAPLSGDGTEVLLPGELAARTEVARRNGGIIYPPDAISALLTAAERADVSPMHVIA